MKSHHALVFAGLFACVMAAAVTGAPGQKAPSQNASAIDWDRARQLYQKQKEGQSMTDDEKAYLNRARQERQKTGAKGGPKGQGQAEPVAAPKPSTGLIPLTELGEGKYRGEDGGLYGGGSNEPPKSQQEAARKATAEIQPLDAEGRPAKDGRIVLISVGMSNTTMEFSQFKATADKDPEENPRLVIVDGAQGGQDSAVWADTEAQVKAGKRDVWAVLDKRIKEAGVTAPQVQVAWLKQARARPAPLGEFPAHARALQADEMKIANKLKERFPNLRVIYLSNRIYAGYATTALNPEPYSYEGAFAVRWLIRDQIDGKPELNFDPARGPVKAPVLLWGPYLWTDGVKPRKSDGLVWKQEDCREDGTHPSASGGRKVVELLMNFFKTDPNAKTWFVGETK